jgi:hypothetical protein
MNTSFSEAPASTRPRGLVRLNSHQNQGNTNLSVNPPGGPGAQAHHLHHLSTGAGRFAGIKGVPPHPRPGEPSLVVTGPLNGCAVHAMHDTGNTTLSFVHHTDYSKNGKAELNGFLAQNPALRPAGNVTPDGYSHPTGVSRIETGATAFMHYDRPANGGPGQWMRVSLLNDWKNGGGGAGTRPELVRPQDLPTQWVQTSPLDLP